MPQSSQVLILDSNPATAKILKLFAEQQGIAANITTSPLEVFNQLNQQAYSLLLIDQLSFLSNKSDTLTEFISKTQKIQPKCKVVLFVEVREQARNNISELSHICSLTKPVDFSQLIPLFATVAQSNNASLATFLQQHRESDYSDIILSIDSVVDYFNDDLEEFSYFIKVFMADKKNTATILQQAVQVGDNKKILEVCHNLKGFCKIFGSHELQAISNEINDILKKDLTTSTHLLADKVQTTAHLFEQLYTRLNTLPLGN